jgi:hypothetical protein
MPETESQPTAENGDQPAGATAETDWKAEARKWETRAKDHQKRISELEPKAKQAEAFEQASKSDARTLPGAGRRTVQQEAEDAAFRRSSVRVAARVQGIPSPLDVDLQGELRGPPRPTPTKLRSQFPDRQRPSQASPGRLAGLLGDRAVTRKRRSQLAATARAQVAHHTLPRRTASWLLTPQRWRTSTPRSCPTRSPARSSPRRPRSRRSCRSRAGPAGGERLHRDPRPDGHPQADWVVEGGVKPGLAGRCRRQEMTGKKLALLVPVSDEVVATNPAGVIDQLRRTCPPRSPVRSTTPPSTASRSAPVAPARSATSSRTAPAPGRPRHGRAGHGGIYADLVTGAGKVVDKNYDFTGIAADPRLKVDATAPTDTTGPPLPGVSDPLRVDLGPVTRRLQPGRLREVLACG